MKRTLKRLSAFLLSALFLLATAIPAAAATDGTPPSEIINCDSYLGDIQIFFADTEADHAWVSKISDVSIDGTSYKKLDFNFGINNEEFYACTRGSGYGEAPYLIISGNAISEKTECVIGAEGYSALVLELTKSGNSYSAIIKDSGTTPDPDPTPDPPAADKEPPKAIKSCTANFNYDFKIEFNNDAQDWLSAIKTLAVDSINYTKVEYSSSVWNNTNFYVDINSNIIYVGEGFAGNTAECVITAEGYSALTLELDKTSHTAAIKDGGTTPTPDVCEHTGGTATCTDKAICEKCDEPYGEIDPDNHNFVDGTCTRCNAKDPNYTKPDPTPADITINVDDSDPTYFILKVSGKDDYVSTLTSITYKDKLLEKTDYKLGLSGTKYYLDTTNNAIYFDKFYGVPFKSGDIITLNHTTYGYLPLKLTISGSDITVKPVTGEEEPGDTMALHVRLRGYFEPAIVGQKGYDAISGASTSVSINKNSNVVVEAALMEKGQEPTESDWKLLHESGITIDKNNTKINMANDFGMAGVYSSHDSSLTLAGEPTKEGEYPISITLTDDQGRTAASNALIFRVYTGYEYLEDQLKLDNCTQTADGKYMYDMVPWAMVNFSKTKPQAVTVPKEIKAWYGSHTSGTYGELGYAVSSDAEPTQTLIIPSGCNLTFVNMELLSSVRIVVEDGGKLILRDSVVQGVIEVEKGGAFSMNYDEYHQEFLTGASINGQLILKDGATLENAKIYSNTNNVPNGTEARQNTNPVVVAQGNVTVKGQVYIKGDEAPTGTDPETQKSYAGQTGLKVENGNLNITEGSVLAVYGGGRDATTSNGGTAIILDKGTISGEGTLIAVGGYGTFSSGGNAAEGDGIISTANAYLEGGNTFKPKEDDAPGSAAAGSVSVTSENKKLVEGTESSNVSENYWGNPATSGSLPNVEKIKELLGVPDTPAAKYTITFAPNGGRGEAYTQKVTSSDGSVTLQANSFTRSKYRFKGWNTEADGSGTAYANGASITVNEDTTLYAQWKKKKKSSGSDSSEKTYDVSKAEVENGTVKVSPSKAAEGEKVTVTVTPDTGYLVKKVTVTDKDGDKLKVKEGSNGKYTFSMPASAVTVKVSFEEEAPAAEENKTILLTIDQRTASVFGETVVNDVAPVIRNARTLLPIRFVAEALGAEVAWDAPQQKVTITKDDLSIDIFIGSPFALVNGDPVQLDAPAFIENSRTYLPLRFIAENLGAEVAWDQSAQQVTITVK